MQMYVYVSSAHVCHVYDFELALLLLIKQLYTLKKAHPLLTISHTHLILLFVLKPSVASQLLAN